MYKAILVVMIMLSSLTVQAEEKTQQTPAQNSAQAVVVVDQAQAKYEQPNDFLYEEQVKDVLVVPGQPAQELVPAPSEDEKQADTTDQEHPLYNDL